MHQVLSGGTSGGMFYWEFGGFSSGGATFSIVANTPDYAEVDCLFTSASSGIVDIHFSMLRGSTGFYVTPIWGHRSVDAAISLGETRDNIYAGSTFNWMSVDKTRNRLMEVSGGSAIGVLGAPVEVSLWTNGIYAGQYEDKYKYSADFGEQRAWGWSSVGAGGRNIGLWNISASVEVFQRRADEARIDGAHRHDDPQRFSRQPFWRRDGFGMECGRGLDARLRAVFHLLQQYFEFHHGHEPGGAGAVCGRAGAGGRGGGGVAVFVVHERAGLCASGEPRNGGERPDSH